MVYFIYPCRFQGHYNYFHSIVAKLCTTDHQSFQEPETLSVGHFFQKKLFDLCEISKMVLLYLNILTMSIVQLWQLFDKKNAITFDQKEIEKKKISRRHEILLRIQCCHKKCQNRKKKISFFPKIFSTKSPFFFLQNCRFLKNLRYIIRFRGFFPSF